MKHLPLIALLLLAACGSGPGAAPQPSTSSSHDISSGTSNDIYHGR